MDPTLWRNTVWQQGRLRFSPSISLPGFESQFDMDICIRLWTQNPIRDQIGRKMELGLHCAHYSILSLIAPKRSPIHAKFTYRKMDISIIYFTGWAFKPYLYAIYISVFVLLRGSYFISNHFLLSHFRTNMAIPNYIQYFHVIQCLKTWSKE